MKLSKIGLIAVGCLVASMSLSACDNEQTSSTSSDTSPNHSSQPIQPGTIQPGTIQPGTIQPGSNDADLARQQAINRQLDTQSHYGKVSDYQRTSTQQSQDYLDNSKAKSLDPASAP